MCDGETRTAVIAGLVAATPMMWHGGAQVIGVAGTSPAMTTRWLDRGPR
jgi:hypothetical protein